MKIHFENKLVFIEYQNTIDDLVETIEKTIPDRIDNINISASLEFCNGYKNSNSLISNLNVILHIFMAGYLNENSISRNIHRRFVFNDTNIKSQKIDKVIDIQIIQLLLLIIQFAKTGELTIQQEIGEENVL